VSPIGVIGLIGLAGVLGGMVNALIASEGFILSRMEALPDGRRIWRPGFIGNLLIGALAALILAFLYTPLGSVGWGTTVPVQVPLTLRELAGAFLSGVGGARILTDLVTRRYEEYTRRGLGTTIQNLTRPGSSEERKSD